MKFNVRHVNESITEVVPTSVQCQERALNVPMLIQSKKSSTEPTFHGPRKNLSIDHSSIATERGPLGFGPIFNQFDGIFFHLGIDLQIFIFDIRYHKLSLLGDSWMYPYGYS